MYSVCFFGMLRLKLKAHKLTSLCKSFSEMFDSEVTIFFSFDKTPPLFMPHCKEFFQTFLFLYSRPIPLSYVPV